MAIHCAQDDHPAHYTCQYITQILIAHKTGIVSTPPAHHFNTAMPSTLEVADIIPPEMESSQTTKSPELSTTQDPQSGSCTQSPRPSSLLTPRDVGLISMMANMPQVRKMGNFHN
ncbi:hypothetical protein E2C01_086486 [Portunus trituberculatus]|uniref:Uncharacterized protein n=1 Tax=Portunus trituberculatus TaxID=210409 RepID=A0A5B7JEQ0_PORTR|nr:hypothetical protein [Portunus trituberculatus]